MTSEGRNMELMQTLDDAWNAQDWDTFKARHNPDVVVRWPGKGPTNGIQDHRAEGIPEGIQMFKTFPITASGVGLTRSSSRLATGRARSRVSPAR